MKWRWWASLLPLLLGGMGWWLVRQGWGNAWITDARYANPRLTLQATGLLSHWLLAIGIALSLGCLLFVATAWRRDQQQGRTLADRHTQALAERRRLLQRLDHELKNPLTAMRAALANLLATAQDREQVNTLQSLETQTVRLSRLTADLRKLAELDARPLETAPVDLAELLQEAVDLAQEKAETQARQVTLTVPRAPWPLARVAGDRDLLFLAFYNLLDNALKFTRPGDTVEVRAREDGSAVVVEVADTGPGIAPEELPHIWEELYRGANARSTPGSGLGLALVRAIVQRHAGQIQLKSRVSQGTLVTVRLPVA